jgi:hypothetical protein
MYLELYSTGAGKQRAMKSLGANKKGILNIPKRDLDGNQEEPFGIKPDTDLFSTPMPANLT